MLIKWNTECGKRSHVFLSYFELLYVIVIHNYNICLKLCTVNKTKSKQRCGIQSLNVKLNPILKLTLIKYKNEVLYKKLTQKHRPRLPSVG